MGSHKILVEVYADVGLDPDGLRKQVSIGDESHDQEIVKYTKLVDKEISYRLKPDNTLDSAEYFDLLAVAEALLEAGHYLRKKILKMTVND